MGDFATFGRSAHSRFLVLLGDFDWDDMNEVGRVEAAIWFWSFTVLVLWVMPNMLLAIVMDTYMEVKGRIGSAETVVSQAREVWRRGAQRRRGERVGLIEMQDSLVNPYTWGFGRLEGDGERITPERFIDKCQNLRIAQATRILTNAQTFLDVSTEQTPSLSDAIGHIAEIDSKVERIKDANVSLIQLSSLMAERQSFDAGVTQNNVKKFGATHAPEAAWGSPGADEQYDPYRDLQQGLAGSERHRGPAGAVHKGGRS
jgi:hypothetical protein